MSRIGKVAWYGPRNRTRQETEDRSRNSSPQVHHQLWAPGNQLYQNITSMKIWSVRMEAKGKERWQLVSLYLCGSKPFLIKYRSYIKCHDSILNSQVETHIYSRKMKAGGASKTWGVGGKMWREKGSDIIHGSFDVRVLKKRFQTLNSFGKLCKFAPGWRHWNWLHGLVRICQHAIYVVTIATVLLLYISCGFLCQPQGLFKLLEPFIHLFCHCPFALSTFLSLFPLSFVFLFWFVCPVIH